MRFYNAKSYKGYYENTLFASTNKYMKNLKSLKSGKVLFIDNHPQKFNTNLNVATKSRKPLDLDCVKPDLSKKTTRGLTIK